MPITDRHGGHFIGTHMYNLMGLFRLVWTNGIVYRSENSLILTLDFELVTQKENYQLT